MKFDTIIIGGGLSGLTAGIELSRKGQKCLVVSSGQSALHFFSGSLELFAAENDPFDAVSGLDASHPYSKIGLENVKALSASSLQHSSPLQSSLLLALWAIWYNPIPSVLPLKLPLV